LLIANLNRDFVLAIQARRIAVYHVLEPLARPAAPRRPLMLAKRGRSPFSLPLGVAMLSIGASLAIAACPSAGDMAARVAGVTERLEIELADGRILRLAGLDTPDPHRGEPETGEKARAFLALFLANGDVAVKALAPKPDRWNRILADVFVAGPGAEPAQSAAAAWLSAGFARVRPEVETRDCQSIRLAAEDMAREQGLGLWTDPYYSVVQAGDSEDLQGRDGLFAIVEGKVIRVGVGRSRYTSILVAGGPSPPLSQNDRKSCSGVPGSI
jgi:endonuclease YncB( thermonuclease family)